MKAGTKIAKLIAKRRLTDKFWWFELEFEENYRFRAGQYVSVRVSKAGERRSYSIATAPNGRVIGLLLDVSPMGVGSRFFLDLLIGEKVEVLGPLGRFVINEPTPGVGLGAGLLFVATGSGIAPVRPMIEDCLRRRESEYSLYLIWGLRSERDIFWQKEFGELEQEYGNFRFDLTLSRPSQDWRGKKGRVTDLIDKMETLKSFGGIYLCGSSEMVEDCNKLLLEKGVGEEKIHFEKYG